MYIIPKLFKNIMTPLIMYLIIIVIIILLIKIIYNIILRGEKSWFFNNMPVLAEHI